MREMAIINVSIGMIFLSNFQVASFSFWRDFKEVYWLREVRWVAGRRIFFIEWILNFDKIVAVLQW